AGAIDVARVEHRREQLHALRRHALRAALARDDALGREREARARRPPVLKDREHARIGRVAEDGGGIVDLLLDQYPGAGLAPGLIAHQAVAHGGLGDHAYARFTRPIQSRNAAICSVMILRVGSSSSRPSASILFCAMPMKISGLRSQCTPSPSRMRRRSY